MLSSITVGQGPAWLNHLDLRRIQHFLHMFEAQKVLPRDPTVDKKTSFEKYCISWFLQVLDIATDLRVLPAMDRYTKRGTGR
jgi:hypothetical protein